MAVTPSSLETLQLQVAPAARVVTSNVVRWVPSAIRCRRLGKQPQDRRTVLLVVLLLGIHGQPLLLLCQETVFKFLPSFRDFQTGIRLI